MTIREGEATDQEKSQTMETESMTWEKDIDQREKIVFDENLAPSFGPKNGQASPHGLETKSGPLAMIYDKEKGWSAKKLGLNSRHWKRLAREVKKELKGDEKRPKCLKRVGPTPLCELDLNVIDIKHRKEDRSDSKQIRSSSKEEKKIAGEKAVAARQHRYAS